MQGEAGDVGFWGLGEGFAFGCCYVGAVGGVARGGGRKGRAAAGNG